MRRKYLGILGLVLVAEISIALVLVLLQPGGFKSLSSWGGPERRQEVAAKTFETQGQATLLDVRNSAGSMTIRQDSNATAVTVQATKVVRGDADEFDRLSYEVTQKDNTITIRADQQPKIGLFIFDGNRVDLQIVTPPNVAAKVVMGSGDLQLQGLESQAQDFSLETGSGTITANNLSGRTVRFKSGSGTIRAANLTSSLDAQTGSGEVIINGANISNSLTLHTGSGNVRFTGQVKLATDSTISTGSGEVALTLQNSGDTVPRLEIKTGSGDIRFDRKDVAFSLTDKHHLITTNSGPTLKVNTGSGDVKVAN